MRQLRWDRPRVRFGVEPVGADLLCTENAQPIVGHADIHTYIPIPKFPTTWFGESRRLLRTGGRRERNISPRVLCLSSTLGSAGTEGLTLKRF